MCRLERGDTTSRALLLWEHSVTLYSEPSTAQRLTILTASDDQTRFVRFVYQDASGYAEIVAGQTRASDPSKIDLVMSTRRWLYIDPLRPDLDAALLVYAATLMQQYSNVYISVRLYTRQAKTENTRKEAYALPSRVIFVDDAPADPTLPYSAFVQTSAHSGHGYYLADTPVSKTLGKRAAAALGGDPSGYDLTQLVRLPGTLNTKNNNAFRVTLRTLSNRAYTKADLCAAFPEILTRPTDTNAPITPIAWPAAEQALGNITALLRRAELTMKPDTQTRRILAGELLTFTVHGHPTNDRSMNRCAVAHGLLLAGFPDDEIAAVLWARCDWGHAAQKGSSWLQADIERCIADAHTAHPSAHTRQNRTKLRQDQPPTPILHRPRARKTCPQRYANSEALLPDLLELQDVRGKICKDRGELAEALRISIATLDRLLKPLREAGKIQWHCYNRRQESYLEISDDVLSSFLHPLAGTASPCDPQSALDVLSAQTILPIPTPDLDDEANRGYTRPPEACPLPAVAAELPTSDAASSNADQAQGGAVCSPSPASEAPLTELRTAIREAFDAVPRLYPNAATGEVGKVTLKRVVAFLEAAGRVCEPATIAALVQEERYRRQALTLKALSFNALRAELRLAESKLAQIRKQGGNSSYWRVRIDVLQAEMRLRPCEPEEVKRRRRRGGPVRPDQRAAAVQYEQELLDQVDAALGRAPLRGFCGRQTTRDRDIHVTRVIVHG